MTINSLLCRLVIGNFESNRELVFQWINKGYYKTGMFEVGKEDQASVYDNVYYDEDHGTRTIRVKMHLKDDDKRIVMKPIEKILSKCYLCCL